MDPQSMSQKTQEIDAIRLAFAADVTSVEIAAIVIICVLVCVAAWMIVALWRHVQHEKAARRDRDRDRLAQEADPEGWARRQAHQAQG